MDMRALAAIPVAMITYSMDIKYKCLGSGS